jgi:hypothetical protein
MPKKCSLPQLHIQQRKTRGVAQYTKAAGSLRDFCASSLLWSNLDHSRFVWKVNSRPKRWIWEILAMRWDCGSVLKYLTIHLQHWDRFHAIQYMPAWLPQLQLSEMPEFKKTSAWRVEIDRWLSFKGLVLNLWVSRSRQFGWFICPLFEYSRGYMASKYMGLTKQKRKKKNYVFWLKQAQNSHYSCLQN